MLESPKACTYNTIKNRVCLEAYFETITNKKHRTGLTRFRLSNHDLLIEKGMHMRPRLDRSDRKCFICKDKVENERHFIVECPAYEKERKELFDCCYEKCPTFEYIHTEEQKFIFIMTNEDIFINKKLGKYIFECFKIRQCLKETI